MDAAVNRFIYFLKRNGIRVSPSESIDALGALSYISLDEREALRTVLRSTLIKDTRDTPIFEELFELFFTLPQPGRRRSHGHDHPHHHDSAPAEPERIVFEPDERGITNPDDRHPHGKPVPIRDFFDLDKMVTRFNPHQDPNQLSLSAFSQSLILNRNKGLLERVMKKVTHQLSVRRVKNIAQPGELNFQAALEQIDEDLIVNAVEELLEELGDSGVDEERLKELAGQIEGVIANLPELLKRYIEREMALQRIRPSPEADAPVHSAYDYRFTESERREMEEIIRRLSRRMRGARSYRRVISHRGRISIPHTLRSNMGYEGIPFNPVLTRYRNEKPRLVVICDVSLSVRNTARFMLHLVYSLQSLFEQVRSFIFVSDLAEVSQYFAQTSIDEAIGLVFSGDLIDTDVNSNYGRALESFHTQYLSAVTGQTTVIILGDGRGNRNPPKVWALEGIRRRAKQLIWLSPEPRGSWGLGSSDMPLYEPVCHRAEVVRNLQQLGRLAEDLLRGSRARAHSG